MDTIEEIERQRRSIAMLPPGAWAMKREDALKMFAALLRSLRAE